jgi:hypothetical protein
MVLSELLALFKLLLAAAATAAVSRRPASTVCSAQVVLVAGLSASQTLCMQG